MNKPVGIIRANGIAGRIRNSPMIPWLVLLSVLAGFCVAAPPPAGPPRQNIRFAVIGDSGTGKQGQWAIARAMGSFYDRDPFELVLMLGDNIYGGVSRRSLQQCFEKPYGKLIERGVEFYASLGNHGSSLAECVYKPFHMEGRHYYTFIRGDNLVQFFALDSNQMDREQLEWLGKELAKRPLTHAARTPG